MTDFFIKTDTAATGPFSGIELREAALARVLTTRAMIGPSLQGPWTPATEIGLFSQAKTPLPHPDEVHVPQFHVRGLSFAADGPFKLRELIGFAVRGMLADTVELQSDMTRQWIPVGKIPILSACLTGELGLSGAEGQVQKRPTRSVRESAPSMSTGSFEETPIEVETEPVVEPSKPKVIVETAEASDSGRQRWVRFPQWNQALSLSGVRVSRRVAVYTLAIALLGVGIASAYSRWQRMAMDPDQILGDWIAPDHSLAISLRENGDCVVFNQHGNSWTGQYEWVPLGQDRSSFQSNQDVSSQITQIEANDLQDDVQRTDGYVRLRSSVFEKTYVGGKELSDAFFRRHGDELRLGYLAAVHWSSSGERMEAGWKVLRQQGAVDADPLSVLAKTKFEPPPELGFAVEQSAHVSVVATKLVAQSNHADQTFSPSDGLCYSVHWNAQTLLQQFGIPDEARPVIPFDQASLPRGIDFSESQIVRYRTLRILLSAEGKLQHLSLVP